ncbi:glucoamylase family protein [Roseiconus nitratireducens]|uniref:glucoamylase family protein n=1 Tax=Roseiconus nitratireducens TaxID=2605748 RepID=UPI001F43AFAD|nr:glucoamylase family protein [Roseiconus nitratireducens]
MSDGPGDAESRLLNLMQERCYRFFCEAADGVSGLIPDRAPLKDSGNGKIADRYRVASSASCGFGLAAYAVGMQNGWESPEDAGRRCERLLRTLVDKVQHERGFLYHFVDRRTGRRSWRSEASSIDTALAAAGAMVAGSVFGGRIAELADQLIDRIDWQWMLNGSDTLSMGWTPEDGFLSSRWDRYSELMVMLLIAIGARRSPIDPACWYAWNRSETLHCNGQPFVTYAPLFVHQYSHAFFDFRRWVLPDDFDPWQNSVLAHRAHIEYLKGLGQRYPDRFGHYDQSLWGVTSSDSASGYRDWGGPYRDGCFEPARGMDGTVVPSAAAGALPMVPKLALQTLRHQFEMYGYAIFGRYGFTNAFNPATGWIGPDVVGIDTGISLLMAENLMRESVWDAFMKHPVAKNAIDRLGFTPRAETA